MMNSVFNPSSQSSYSDVAIQFAIGAAVAGTAEGVGWVVSKGAAKYFAKRAAALEREALESAGGRLATPIGTPKVPDGAVAGVPNAGIAQRTAASERAATQRVAEVTGNTEPPRWLPPDEPRGSGTAARPEGTAVPAPDALHPPELELRFSQRDARAHFSNNPKARFPGETIGSVAEKLRTGVLTPADVPVQYVDIGNGRGLIYDTRSSLALRRAGVPQSEWSLLDASNDARVVDEIKARLVRNNLPADGIDTIRITRPPDPVTKQPFPDDVSYLL